MSALESWGVALPGRLHATDLTLESGSLTVLVGPNGSGKTSLLHAIAGIGRTAGSVSIDKRPLNDIAPHARSAVLGYVPASRELVWRLSVEALVRLTAPRASAGAVVELFAAMSLSDFAHRPVTGLSTGERSRVLIARALLPRPRVLLLDEPFANLDPLWQLRLAERLRREAAGGMTILCSAHDLDLAARLGSRMLVMDGGRLVADGEPEALMEDGTIAHVFGVTPDESRGWREA